MDKLRETNSTKRQIALMRLYHCISLIEWKAGVFRRRMNLTRQKESRVVVVEILKTRNKLPKGTRIAVELIYCAQCFLDHPQILVLLFVFLWIRSGREYFLFCLRFIEVIVTHTIEYIMQKLIGIMNS